VSKQTSAACRIPLSKAYAEASEKPTRPLILVIARLFWVALAVSFRKVTLPQRDVILRDKTVKHCYTDFRRFALIADLEDQRLMLHPLAQCLRRYGA
jgi:hypothetical protein